MARIGERTLSEYKVQSLTWKLVSMGTLFGGACCIAISPFHPPPTARSHYPNAFAQVSPSRPSSLSRLRADCIRPMIVIHLPI